MGREESECFIETYSCPFKTRILDGETTPQPIPQEEPEDCNQTGTLEDPTQEDQEDSPDDKQSPDIVPQSGDEPSVSTRPWTRSQGPPPSSGWHQISFQMWSQLNSFPAARAGGRCNSSTKRVCW